MVVTSEALLHYCNEHVFVCLCVSVCPRVCLPNNTHDLYQFLCMLPIAMARSSSGGVMQSQGEVTILGVFFATDNVQHSIWDPYENG